LWMSCGDLSFASLSSPRGGALFILVALFILTCSLIPQKADVLKFRAPQIYVRAKFIKIQKTWWPLKRGTLGEIFLTDEKSCCFLCWRRVEREIMIRPVCEWPLTFNCQNFARRRPYLNLAMRDLRSFPLSTKGRGGVVLSLLLLCMCSSYLPRETRRLSLLRGTSNLL
jgi:hypothetical protein